MSNIHQNDELLRVQDQNYDIVFNYDKHENGGVAVHAEKDGKNHKVNPEYARAALVKQIGAGGGWPADLPKPSVGGYGYTEQGEQTVITWDGDTEGRYDFHGLYMVSEEVPSQDSIIGASITFHNGYVLDVTSDIIEGEPNGLFYILDGDRVACLVATEDIDIEDEVINKGTYFAKEGNDYPTSLTYSTHATIHKIDEKYLPVWDGGVV